MVGTPNVGQHMSSNMPVAIKYNIGRAQLRDRGHPILRFDKDAARAFASRNPISCPHSITKMILFFLFSSILYGSKNTLPDEFFLLSTPAILLECSGDLIGFPKKSGGCPNPPRNRDRIDFFKEVIK
jgi:hypothetical protein